jgi:surfeit locus 1 family protein
VSRISRFTSPRWLIAHATVVLIAVLFISLGFWQLGRLEERRLENIVGAARFGSDPADIAALVDGAASDFASLEFRRATAVGVFQPKDEVLVRSQVNQGIAGYHLLTPMVLDDGRALIVNRGWVPLEASPSPDAPSASGPVEITGWLRPGQSPRPLAPKDPPEGRLDVMVRVDLERLAEQIQWPLLPVYLVLSEPVPGGYPVPVAQPRFDQEGPHLGYAIQWFGFTATGIAGYFFLLRKASITKPR